MDDSAMRRADWGLRGAALIALLITGWSIGSLLRPPHAVAWAARSSSRRPRVLTTIFPLYDIARQVGGADIEVHNLLGPGMDPHEFALSPRDVSLVAGADVLVANGAGLDDFLTTALEKASIRPPPIRRQPIFCSLGLPRLSTGQDQPGGESGDPHLWLDPLYARRYAERVATALEAEMESRGDAAAARRTRDRAAAFEARLAALDSDYRVALGPLHGTSFIAFHGAFAYLATRYGLNIAGVWEPTPGHQPAPKDVGAIIRVARSRRVSALFSEPQFSSRALEMIAHDAKLPVYSLDPLETASRFDETHYIEVMRANLATLVKALGPRR